MGNYFVSNYKTFTKTLQSLRLEITEKLKSRGWFLN